MPDEITYSIAINQFAEILISLAGAALLAVGTWAAKRLADRLKLSADSEARAYLNEAIQGAIAYAAGQARVKAAHLEPIQVKSALAAQAANYLLPKVPDALNRLGIDPAGLQQIIVARLNAPPPTAPVAMAAVVEGDVK